LNNLLSQKRGGLKIMKNSHSNCLLKTYSANRIALIGIAMILMVTTKSVIAADVYWDGGSSGTGSSLSTTNNWVGNVNPTATDRAIISTNNLTSPATAVPGVMSISTANLYASSLTFANNFNTSNSVTVGNGSGNSGSASTIRLYGDSSANLIDVQTTSGTITIANIVSGAAANATLKVQLFGSGAMNVASGATLSLSSAVENGAGISSVNLTKTGQGTLILDSANTYVGQTILNAGTLQVGSPTALSTSAVTINGGVLAAKGSPRTLGNNITVGGDFTLGGAGQSLTLNGTVALGGATRAITLLNDATLGGVISNGGLTLISANSRSLTLNAANTYALSTTVNGGTLTVGTSGSIDNSTLIDIKSGATFNVSSKTSGFTVGSGQILKNNGTVTGALVVNGGLQGSGSLGAVTLNNGSLLNPGNSPGNLTATSAIWNSGATYNWEIASLTGSAGTNWDLFTVSGALNLSNLSSSAKFNLTLDSGGALAGFSPTAEYSWTFAKAASITGLTSTTAGTDISSLFNIAAGNFNGGVGPTNGFKVLVGETTGGYTSLNIVPEPSTPALMGLGMVALLAVRSIRRRLS
jgi:autotransporter-associated beta strand protein